jgi:hypothetical protein
MSLAPLFVSMSPNTPKQPLRRGREVTARAMPKSKRHVVVCIALMCRLQVQLRSHRCPAPVAEQERAQHKAAERDPGQDALHVVVSADPKQDNHDNEPGVRGFIRKDIEDRSATHVSYEIKRPSDGKTNTLRPRNIGAIHLADEMGVTGRVAWLKRLWDHLTSWRRSSIAFFGFPRSRSYYKVRPFSHHFRGAVPGHGTA